LNKLEAPCILFGLVQCFCHHVYDEQSTKIV
jgi:hypothetical protein